MSFYYSILGKGRSVKPFLSTYTQFPPNNWRNPSFVSQIFLYLSLRDSLNPHAFEKTHPHYDCPYLPR